VASDLQHCASVLAGSVLFRTQLYDNVIKLSDARYGQPPCFYYGTPDPP
jgi:hypothetical protein